MRRDNFPRDNYLPPRDNHSTKEKKHGKLTRTVKKDTVKLYKNNIFKVKKGSIKISSTNQGPLSNHNSKSKNLESNESYQSTREENIKIEITSNNPASYVILGTI